MPHVYYLPFAESLDYCRVGYIVPLARGRRVPLMAELLDALGAVSASEWAQRRRAAELAGDAFVSRETGPTAAHHLIAQMCRMAAQARCKLPLMPSMQRLLSRVELSAFRIAAVCC